VGRAPRRDPRGDARPRRARRPRERLRGEAAALADRIDDLSGAAAPVHDRHHVREFAVRVDQPAAAIAGDLETEGFAVHAIDEHLLQVCVTDLNADRTDGLVAAFEEVI